MSGFRTALRALASRIVRPVWRRVWARVENRLDPIERRLAATDALVARIAALEHQAHAAGRHDSRVAALAARLDDLAPHVDAVANAVTGWGNRVIAIEARPDPSGERLLALETAWRQHIPAFLNGVGTVSALAHAVAGQGKRLDDVAAQLAEALPLLDNARRRLDNNDDSTKALWERIEFTRQEILFEMAHGAARRDAAPTAAQILNPAKVEAQRAGGGLRLNLGAGHIALPGYVNVDRRALPGIDVVADADALPFEPGSVEEIASAHLLEHVPNEAMRRRFLPHWLSLLRPGGTFRAITPDAQAMLAAAAAGTYAFAEFREALFGGQDYEGDYHFNIFTPDSLAALLQEAGLVDIAVPVAGRRNGKCFEFEITARRP